MQTRIIIFLSNYFKFDEPRTSFAACFNCSPLCFTSCTLPLLTKSAISRNTKEAKTTNANLCYQSYGLILCLLSLSYSEQYRWPRLWLFSERNKNKIDLKTATQKLFIHSSTPTFNYTKISLSYDTNIFSHIK